MSNETVISYRCAVIDDQSNIVGNVIMANPDVDNPPANTFFVKLPDDSLVSIGWIYNPSTKTFTDPNNPN